jgi:polyphenol oxidase
MIGKEKVHNGVIVGRELITPHCHYFFGNHNASREGLGEIFPDFRFYHLAQVHGDQVVEGGPTAVKADAHWSLELNCALVIQTADCLPVLMGGPHMVTAIHAGWRGVEAEILMKSASLWLKRSWQPDEILIGPHIQSRHFEVGTDVADRLSRVAEKSGAARAGGAPPHPMPEKRYVDLAQIVSRQSRASFGEGPKVIVSTESTFDSPHYHSFRRGKNSGARQYSFVARLA